ncbi:CBS domain-containing protein [Noviherbaspirillum pedocola]|uniref:CBS domain-containing protein n=1 Tax=Noviherbaspirillum pedocola TaxID=2801341 RepID=A0A934T327_9BURK|nr:CBS domain-containing protein [Noviherbaspirillum pedocola]MBK4738857.1 CBS domain-containing protein [Noviherbaspirillum pedocola]
MPISECSNSKVVSCNADAALPEVAALMRRHHVGDVVVIEERDGRRVPLGIVTDRDIVLETMALDLDAKLFTAGDIVMGPAVTVGLDAGFVETLRLMRQHGIRRLPVVDASGALAGIVTGDDIVRLLSLELSLLTGAIASEQRQERRLRKSMP